MSLANRPFWFAGLAIAQLFYALIAIWIDLSQGTGVAVLAALIGAALCFDNGVIAAGGPLLARGSLESLSRCRYALHVILTPLLLPLCLLLASQAGLQLLPPLLLGGWLFALGWIAAGWWLSYRNLDLVLLQQGPLVRFHNRNKGGQPWLRLLLVWLTLLIASLSFVVPNHTAAWGFRLGSLAMLCGAMLARRVGLVAGNAGELMLMAGFNLALLS